MESFNQLEYVNKLVKEYHYKKLPEDLSIHSRKLYRDYVESLGFNIDGSTDKLYSLSGILISNGYNRVVLGDYGAYVEILNTQIIRDNLVISSTQKNRLYQGYKYKSKYLWYHTYDSLLKIYYQLRTVNYADYIPKRFYVAPSEIMFDKEDE